jgi:hypothetical protein
LQAPSHDLGNKYINLNDLNLRGLVKMNKIVTIVFILLVMVALTGCLAGNSKKTETKIKTDDGEVEVKTEIQVDKEATESEIKVETDKGEQTITIKGTAGEKGDEWCPEGGDWKMESSGVQGEATASWRVERLETSGKYAGLCHVIYTAQTPEGEMKVEYWFDETGEKGYYEMEVGGQKITQEFNG